MRLGILSLGCSLALLLTSCSSDHPGYDPELHYPIRRDPLVLELPKSPPVDKHAFGMLDRWISELGDRGAALADPAHLSPQVQKELAHILDELFGTPANPRVGDRLVMEQLGLDARRMVAGSVLYKDKCIQCHGMNGDGRGPTSLMVYPPARDFRRGRLKFVSTNANGIPVRSDLARVIRQGINGNSMPPFELLTPDQIENLIAYTIHLMMRGQVEFAAIRTVLSEDGAPTDLRRFCQQELGRVVSSWQDASKSVVNPATQPVRESGIDAAGSEQDRRIRQGHQLFLLQGGCGSCHKDYGRTDHYLYDFWGIAIRPNNLTLGEYKGGKEPLDLFRRIRGGIPAAGMPATQMSDEQIWDLVAFLQALPVPRKLPEDVRRVIYPQVQ